MVLSGQHEMAVCINQIKAHCTVSRSTRVGVKRWPPGLSFVGMQVGSHATTRVHRSVTCTPLVLEGLHGWTGRSGLIGRAAVPEKRLGDARESGATRVWMELMAIQRPARRLGNLRLRHCESQDSNPGPRHWQGTWHGDRDVDARRMRCNRVATGQMAQELDLKQHDWHGNDWESLVRSTAHLLVL